MDILQSSANLFKDLFNKDYIITAGRKQKLLEITLFFAEEHFHHLIGLQKLLDMPQISKAKSKSSIFKSILLGEITYEKIAASEYIQEVDNRLKYISRINNLLQGNVVIKFDKRKAFTSIDANFLLYEMYDEKYIHLFFEFKKNNVCVPCTLFAHDDYKYVRQQEVYKVLDVKIVTQR